LKHRYGILQLIKPHGGSVSGSKREMIVLMVLIQTCLPRLMPALLGLCKPAIPIMREAWAAAVAARHPFPLLAPIHAPTPRLTS